MYAIQFRHAAWGLFLVAAAAFGQQAATAVAAAPVPPELLSAKKVFVSNGGSDSGLFPHPFSGSQARPYDEFYAAIKSWGRYELVGDPAAAELVFEIRLLAPNGPANADKTKGASDPLPMLRLVIYDRQTHFVLWAVSESVEGAQLQKTHDRNLDDAVGAVVHDLKSLTGQGSAVP